MVKLMKFQMRLKILANFSHLFNWNRSLCGALYIGVDDTNVFARSLHFYPCRRR